ncbi:MAG: OmpA family protein [Bacteroidetes bacterium]|nr:OmpA family protein [Bacteroidota bacterium]
MLTCCGRYVHGQDLKLMLNRSVYLKHTGVQKTSVEPYLPFENINKLPYFENKRLGGEIRSLEGRESKDYEALETLMREYVLKFGIKNFGQDKDLDMLWKLGQLNELLQDTSQAVLLYALALNNHSQHFRDIRLHYDALTAPRRNEYVNLDYYYRIVEARRHVDTLLPPKKVLVRMDSVINAVGKPDYAPFMHPSGQVLVFTSRRGEMDAIGGLGFGQSEDLYYTEKDMATGKWLPAERFPENINSPFNEGSACLNLEGTELIFSRCNAPDSYGLCDLYISRWENGKWSKAENLGAMVNSADWDSHPCLSPDGKILYFASNRGEGFGRTDIWMCRRNPDGTFQKAENVGPVVNTIEDEVTPFLHPVNNTLYFSSTGHVHNFGGFDIFRTRWLTDHWELPRNLGPLVNTSGDEYYFSIDHKAETLFYAKSQVQNKEDFDLYSFPMPMEARPDAVYSLKGYLIDSITQKPITGIVVAIDLDKGVEIAPLHINSYGYFEFNLINNRRYQLLILGENAFRVENQGAMSQDSLFHLFEESIINLKPVVFEELTFAADEATINPTVEDKLKDLVAFIKKHPDCRLEIRGHTDSDGKPRYNLKLSKDRADNLKRYLMDKTGLAADRITAQGFGDTRPVFPNDTPQNKARNRRVEFEIFLPDEQRNKMADRHRPIRMHLSEAVRDTTGGPSEEHLKEQEEEMMKEMFDELEDFSDDEDLDLSDIKEPAPVTPPANNPFKAPLRKPE